MGVSGGDSLQVGGKRVGREELEAESTFKKFCRKGTRENRVKARGNMGLREGFRLILLSFICLYF